MTGFWAGNLARMGSGEGRLTARQRQVLGLLWDGGLARLNLFCGSVRSGKTWGSLWLWALWARDFAPRGASLLMAGKTLDTLRRNCLDILTEIAGASNFCYNLHQRRGVLYGHTVLLMGAADGRAEEKIRGATLGGAYLDELSLLPEGFFAMLLSRLSVPGARLFATTNPENPGHWLKRLYLDRAPKGPRVACPQGKHPSPHTVSATNGSGNRCDGRADALDLRVEEFHLEDNTFLDPAYVRALCAEYTGALYERFVLGRWVAAEGAVYPLFANDMPRFMCDEPRYDWVQVGVDFGGNQSAFAFVACGIRADFAALAALASRRVPAKGVSPEDMYRHLEDFLAFVREKYGPVRVLYADSAEQTLINGLRRRLCVPVRGSLKRPILERVRAVNLLLAQGRLVLTSDCESLAGALRDALYAPGTGRDERLDNGSTDIDSLDAFEYGFERYLGRLAAEGGFAAKRRNTRAHTR